MTYELLSSYWLPVCTAQELKRKPKRVVFHQRPVVLFRGQHGVAALEDRCPHRGAALSEGTVRQGCLVCPYHGWTFEGDGRCREIPGRAREPEKGHSARSVPCRVEHGWVWLGPEQASEPYLSPYLVDPSYDRFFWKVEQEGQLVEIVENFLDAQHTHHVHAGLIRGGTARHRVTATVTRSGDRCQAVYQGEGTSEGLIPKLFEKNRSSSVGRFVLPSVAEIEYRSEQRVEFGMTAYLTPSSQGFYTILLVVATPKGVLPGRLKQLALTPFLKAALRQDRQILANQHANLEAFPKHGHISTELDLLRPHIVKLLRHGPGLEPYERAIEIEL